MGFVRIEWHYDGNQLQNLCSISCNEMLQAVTN